MLQMLNQQSSSSATVPCMAPTFIVCDIGIWIRRLPDKVAVHLGNRCRLFRSVTPVDRYPKTVEGLQRVSFVSLVIALVMTRLDYCYAILADLHYNYKLDGVQSMHTAMVHLIFSARRRNHVTPLLKQFHWLPACECLRIQACCWHHFTHLVRVIHSVITAATA